MHRSDLMRFDDRLRPVRQQAFRTQSVKPIREVPHFKNAALRRKFEAGEVDSKEALVFVPIYRGINKLVLNDLVNSSRRKQRRIKGGAKRVLKRALGFDKADGKAAS